MEAHLAFCFFGHTHAFATLKRPLDFLEYARYDFKYDFVTYKWPSWLNPQSCLDGMKLAGDQPGEQKATEAVLRDERPWFAANKRGEKQTNAREKTKQAETAFGLEDGKHFC